jgi:hypothetical protein
MVDRLYCADVLLKAGADPTATDDYFDPPVLQAMSCSAVSLNICHITAVSEVQR